jgi:exodeoxyribonuclease VII small subunit
VSVKKKNAEPTFEEDLARLEALADTMEQGELPLEELMAAYEEGAALAKTLQQRLSRAKARLSEVKADKDGNIVTVISPIAEQDEPEDDV